MVFNTSTGKVTLAGDTAQSLNGSYNYAFKKLAINKSANQVTANTTLSVDDTLFFVSGNLITTSTNLLTMKAGSKVSGASSSSFVSGPVKKIGNTAFAYPVGRNASYRPIEISAPSTTTSEFTGEYLEDSVSVNTSSRESTLGYLNRNNYWKLNRQVGTSQVYVTLSWDTPNALVDTFVKVASWNGTQWKDLGKGIVSGNRIIGSVQSTNAAQSYLEFSLSYWNINAIPGAPNCSDVQNESDLRYCLTFTTSGSVQVTTNIFVNSFDVDGLNQLPFPIQVDVTLEGKNGLTSPKWWEQYCPIISTNHKSEFTNLTNDNKKSIFLFAMQPGAVVQNLRIRGASCNFQDYNQGDLLCGGIFIENEVGSTIIRNCEIACFSYAGVWKRNLPETLTIENCYIHKVKGECQFGIGYGIWTQGPFNLPAQKMNFTNILFDDCKAAIDGQGYVVDWTINKCSFSQFFHSEEINLHNRNDFRMWDDDDNYDYFYCYQNPNNTCTTSPAFYGYKNNSTAACTTITTPANTPGYTFGWLNFPDIPMYDVGGATTIVSNSIFNKKRTLDSEENGNSHMNLTFPNRDVSKGGFATNGFQILNNTFATKQYSLVELLAVNNLGGYAKIADNAIDACVWEGDAYIVKSGNAFEYQPGVPLSSSTAPIPCELVIELNDGTAPLPTTTTLSPYSNTRFIQHVELNTDFNIAITPGTLGSQILNSIIRPNPNKDPFTTPVNANVISDDNYFYDGEIFTDQTSTIITGYDKPGLYGIDVLAFDAVPNNNIYDFKASPWSHIPIIVNGAVDKTLYFNIKDSYLQDNGPTGVKKQAYFNDLLIWQEDIADGGTGWEYVQVDLTGNGLDASATLYYRQLKQMAIKYFRI
ncbi:MAG: hypothetical protein IPP71_11945 [Bacteroidetes bacterium]|nr:hypothetical protein [Bacteroidota bacterium]